MALPTSYLTSFKNVAGILDAIKKAQAPERFTTKFLQDLGYSTVPDRLMIRMLKTFGLLRDSGEPTQAYHEFLDPSQSGRILADGMKAAYSDLFQINKDAHLMPQAEVRAKMKTISQGAYSDDVLGKMATTFTTLVALGDFDGGVPAAESPIVEDEMRESTPLVQTSFAAEVRRGAKLIYDVHIHLPTTRDPAVYDALFASLTKHLGQ